MTLRNVSPRVVDSTLIVDVDLSVEPWVSSTGLSEVYAHGTGRLDNGLMFTLSVYRRFSREELAAVRQKKVA